MQVSVNILGGYGVVPGRVNGALGRRVMQYVARMQHSEIREIVSVIPDYIAFHPGY